MRILSLHPCGISRVILHAVKFYDMGPSPLLLIREEGVLRIFIALKNLSSWPGSKRQPLGPVASTPTTTPPRRLTVGYTNVSLRTSFTSKQHEALPTRVAAMSKWRTHGRRH
jgi:hypothetical protein